MSDLGCCGLQSRDSLANIAFLDVVLQCHDNALGYSTFRCILRFEGVTDWYQSQGYREPAVMSSASSAVTYTSVYTDSEPGRAFWGADDEEISEGGIPRVIVLGYDGLPIQPVAPPSPDYIPGPEDPQTPPVP
ncbi:hypothetical protein Tco_0144657 [Tanacetum coccineum]